MVGRKGRGEYSIPDWLSLHWDVIGMSRNIAHRYAILLTQRHLDIMRFQSEYDA